MTVQTGADVFRDYVNPAIPASGANKVAKREARALFTFYETLLGSGAAGLGYATLSAINADLLHGANSTAIVYGDPTSANNGLYVKSGASGSGSWSRIGDLPGSIVTFTVTGGSANAITATASETPLVPGKKLYLLTPTANNTAATTINGIPIKNAFGMDLAADSLVNASQVLMAWAVDHYQLLISSDVDANAILASALAAASSASSSATAAASSASALGNQVHQYDTRALAAAATIPTGVQAIKITRHATGYPLSYATYIPGTSTGPMAFQEAGGHFWELDVSGGVLFPEWFGAKGDGTTNDGVAMQKWAIALSDGGDGFAPSKAGYGVDRCVLFMPSTNVAPVQGPKIVGNLKLIGLAALGAAFTGTGSGTNLTVTSVTGYINVGDLISGTGVTAGTRIVSQTSGTTGGAGVYVTSAATTSSGAALTTVTDLLRAWNPTAVTTSQNFYYASFDSIEVSTTTGLSNGVSLRGYWGRIGSVLGTGVNDVVSFPNFIFGGIPDEYESMCDIGNVTGIDYRGYAINNAIGIGASIKAHNVRGTIHSLAAGLGCIYASGSENITGCIAYTGLGPAVTLALPPAPAVQTGAHEIYLQGNGDIDVAEYGFRIEKAEFASIRGHRMNIEPPVSFGVTPSWPLTAYSFGKSGSTGRIVNVTVDPYITIRPGVTSGSGATFTGTGSGTNLTASSVTGTIHVGDYITGTGVLAGTYIVSQTSGTTGGAGVYVTSQATTSSGAALTDVGNIGTLFDFNNEANISNLVVNVSILDAAGILSSMPFSSIYKNINANATIKIIQNGVVVYDNTTVTTFANLPTAATGTRGCRATITDCNTTTYRATAAGSGSNVVSVWCNGTNWLVD